MKKLFVIIFIPICILSQTNTDTAKFKLITPEKEYNTSGIYNIFFGKHWRKLWATPVYAEILNLDTFAGGLTPIEKGGGFQTKSLRFAAKDGNIYKFRSIKKDPSKVLPEELRETVVADILYDQISSSNPFAALTVVPFLNALNIPQSTPKIVILPDTEKLGEFREEFKNLLGLIEIHPNENEQDTTLFLGADKILSTYKLLNRLEEKRDERIDAKTYLKARLLDAFLGDWDRHTDQWRWGRINKNNKKLWVPIPRDRDQVYAKFDGLFPSLATMYVKQLSSFDNYYPPVYKLSYSGRALDDRFLPELTKAEWDSVTNFVVNSLTDSLIKYSVALLPKSHFLLEGENIINTLISRRNKLKNYSNEYYCYINNVVTLNATTKNDLIIVNRVNDNETLVQFFSNKEKNNIPYFVYNFNNNYTKEIRINLLEGDDKALIKGDVNNSPIIRIIGGPGNDTFIDSSFVYGYALGILPIKILKNKTYFYDSNKNTNFISLNSTIVNTENYPWPSNDEERYEPGSPQKGNDIFYYPFAEYNKSNGLTIGLNPEYTKYDFRKFPYDYKISLVAAYATIPKVYNLGLNFYYSNLFNNADLLLSIFRTKLLLTKFYGYGNLTHYDRKLDKNNFYKTGQEVTKINIGIKKNINKNINITLGGEYRYLETNIYNNIISNNVPNSGYGLGKFNSISGSINLLIDYRNSSSYPTSGVYFNTKFTAYPKFYQNKNFYKKLSADLRTYFNFINNAVIALRIGGEKNFGTYPIFDACYLGGKENLRSYVLERFAGDASIYMQSDLRLPITKVKIIINGVAGTLAFAETGKVFTDVADKKWHPSYGTGFYFTALNNTFNIVYNLGFSTELTTHYITTKFAF